MSFKTAFSIASIFTILTGIWFFSGMSQNMSVNLWSCWHNLRAVWTSPLLISKFDGFILKWDWLSEWCLDNFSDKLTFIVSNFIHELDWKIKHCSMHKPHVPSKVSFAGRSIFARLALKRSLASMCADVLSHMKWCLHDFGAKRTSPRAIP